MQKPKPILSVILPCYNAEDFLQFSIPSILDQSFTDFELLIIDDGSVDDSYKISNSYALKDKRIKLFKNAQNLGVVKTLNRGIDLANGSFIARMDADDLSDLKRFEKQLAYLNSNKDVSIVGTRSQAIDLKGNKLNSRSDIYLEWDTIKFSAHFTQPLFHGSVIGRSEAFKSNKYGNDSKAEDFELWLRMISKGIKIENIDETLYYYRMNPDGVSQKNETQQKLDHNNISSQYLRKNYQLEVSQITVDLMNNRPLSAFKTKDLLLALKSFRLVFLKQERKTAELKKYYNRQRVDILFQALKKSSNKRQGLHILLLLVKESLNITALGHMYSKLKKKR